MSAKRMPVSKIPITPTVDELRRLDRRHVRLFFSNGLVLDTVIPTRGIRPESVTCIRIIDGGLAVKFGTGKFSEWSAWGLSERAGTIRARPIRLVRTKRQEAGFRP